MKTYVTYWFCQKCQIYLEYRARAGPVKLTESGPRCSECATKLEPQRNEIRPEVIVDFTR